MYTCAQTSAKFVHSMCTSLDTPYSTLELLLGHFLYTGGVYMIGHWHVYISNQFPSLALQLLHQCMHAKTEGGGGPFCHVNDFNVCHCTQMMEEVPNPKYELALYLMGQ